MARNTYQYGTSPRKTQPERQKQRKRKNLKIVEDLPRQEVKISVAQKRKQLQLTFVVIGIFVVLLTISYRNSQINEKFSTIQSLKKELSSIEKENEQTKVTIENSLNLNTIEKLAKEKLGMQKLTNRQAIYINLPKKDYVEAPTEEVVIEKEQNWFQKLIGKILQK